MHADIIAEVSRAALAGSMAFPELVGQLIEAGVEYYHVDYVALKKTFYSASGSLVISPITYENLPLVAANFDATALKAAIFDSQNNQQHYRDFTQRIMQAGVQGYMAFLHGKRVTYMGRTGDQHTEWFPGAAPASPNEA